MPGPTPSQPGWYDDGDGNERWYDGNGWTDHVRGETAPVSARDDAPTDDTPVGGVPADVPPPPPTTQLSALEVGGGKGLRVAIGLLGALVLVAVVVVGVLVVLGRDDDAKDDGKTDQADTASQTTSEQPASPGSSLDIPTINPSDFPSELPSDLPSIPTENLPSNLPTGFPPDFPSQFPTDPEDWQSWASDFLEQMN